MADIPGSIATTESISVGSTRTGSLELVGDHDWYRLELTAGQTVTIELNGAAFNGVEDPYLRVRDSAGNLLFENDDGGDGLNSRLTFTASYSGVYFIDVGSWNNGDDGEYVLSVETYTLPPEGTMDDIAQQLVSGYWGGSSFHFNVSEGDSLTVNLTALTAAGQNLARQALALWTDIIGVSFVEVGVGGQLTFDDTESGAFADFTTSGQFITSAHINVSTQWLTDYGTAINSYSFQTYVHEVGHALGLGHAGNYNGEGQYPYDASFQIDGWPASVMSYFSQEESSYWSGQGFTENFVVTPMIADIIAMSQLYGLSTTTRAGDTSYGASSGWHTNMGALTIYDSGGTDTFDVAGLGGDQLINLNPGTFSNIMGEVGNVSIARGVIIENAKSSSGHDTLIGNDADNVLDSGAGNDSLAGGAGNDWLIPGWGNNSVDGGIGTDTVDYIVGASAFVSVNLALGIAHNQGGAGTDTLISIENVRGTHYADTIIGNDSANDLEGHQGDDNIDGGGGNDVLFGDVRTGELFGDDNLIGGAGDDHLDGGRGNDRLDGGTGIDTASYRNATSGVIVSLALTSAQNTGGGDTDTLISIENLLGSDHNDRLSGNSAANVLDGGSGADLLIGGGGADILDGGAGADTFVYNASGDSTDASRDHILQFQSGVDKIDLTGLAVSSVSWTQQTDTGTGLPYNLVNVVTATGAMSIRVNGSVSMSDFIIPVPGQTITGTPDEDKLYGGEGADTISGLGSNDTLFGFGGSDVLRGDAGADYVNGGTGDDRLYGGDGNDLLRDSEGSNSLFGEAGDDRIYSGSAADYVDAGSGNDSVFSGDGDDHLRGGAGEDYMFAGFGNDRLYGGDDADNLRGYNGDDQLFGEAGDDRLYAGNNDDYVSGGIGNDSLFGEADNDRLDGGDGDDYLDGSFGNDQLFGEAGSDRLRGGAGVDHLDGGIDSDSLYGGDANDALFGGDGDDFLFGEAGSDTLEGGAGNDYISGGLGSDILSGGAGSDSFRFDTTLSGIDQILDFSPADDAFSLNRAIFSGIAVNGSLNASAFRLGTAAADADDRIIYDQANGRIYYDADGAGGVAQVLFATVTAGTLLSSADFYVYG